MGAERPAVQLGTGEVLDVGGLVDDIDGAALSPERLRQLERAIGGSRPELPVLDLASARTGPPLTRIGKIVCIGLNYRAHAAESGQEPPAEPVIFMKAPSTVVGPADDVLIPPTSSKTDYEVELAVVIGRTARYLTSKDGALGYVAGYAISNDVSEREYQIERGGQWDKGKNCETFNPFGPLLVTADEVGDPQSLALESKVNGEVRQSSTTADMIFGVEHLIWYVSQFMVLYPGDVINTGTPQGVGLGFKPPRYLNDGDVVEMSVTGLGSQRVVCRRASV